MQTPTQRTHSHTHTHPTEPSAAKRHRQGSRWWQPARLSGTHNPLSVTDCPHTLSAHEKFLWLDGGSEAFCVLGRLILYECGCMIWPTYVCWLTQRWYFDKFKRDLGSTQINSTTIRPSQPDPFDGSWLGITLKLHHPFSTIAINKNHYIERSALILVWPHFVWSTNCLTAAPQIDLQRRGDVEVNSRHPGCPPKRQPRIKSRLRAAGCSRASKYNATKWRLLICLRTSVCLNLQQEVQPGVKPNSSRMHLD